MDDINLIELTTGGQTGVDRAVLDFALAWRLPCGGWCPKGRLAEDGIIPDLYPVKEWETASYEDRTRQNILDSDAVLILYGVVMDEGTRLTLHLAEELQKPHMAISLDQDAPYTRIRKWLDQTSIRRLNIAGPRASRDGAIHTLTLKFLEKLYGKQGIY